MLVRRHWHFAAARLELRREIEDAQRVLSPARLLVLPALVDHSLHHVRKKITAVPVRRFDPKSGEQIGASGFPLLSIALSACALEQQFRKTRPKSQRAFKSA